VIVGAYNNDKYVRYDFLSNVSSGYKISAMCAHHLLSDHRTLRT